MSFDHVGQLQHKAVAFDQMCGVLEVSGADYYAAVKRS